MRYLHSGVKAGVKPAEESKVRLRRMKKYGLPQYILWLILFISALFCFLPVLLILIVSFSSEASVSAKGFSFFPMAWTLDSYKYVFTFKDQLINSYLITIFETVCGSALTVLFTAMFAFVLSRKEFKLNRFFTIYLLITMLFNGGMLSSYLVNTNIYHLRNNLLILILPGCVTAWNCIIMRTFIQSNVPEALIDAAKIDGAGEMYTFFKIVTPIMVPVLAAIGFMAAMTHWNEWQTAFLYIDKTGLATLQLMLMRIEKNLSYMQERANSLSPEELLAMKNAPTETARMAILFFTMGPVMVAYPFFQKYFIKGITIGAVKG